LIVEIPLDETQSHISFGIQTGKSSRVKLPSKQNIEDLNSELQKIYSPFKSELDSNLGHDVESDSKFRSPSFPYIPESAPSSPIN